MVKRGSAVEPESSSYAGGSSSSRSTQDSLARQLREQHVVNRLDDVDDSEDEEDGPSGSSRLENEDEAPERTRFAQYIDSEDDLDSDQELDNDHSSTDGTTSDGDSDDDELSGPGKLSRATGRDDEESRLRDKLAQVPFSALVKARRSMAPPTGSDDEDDEEPDEFEEERQSARRYAERKAQRAIEKRESKHAPTEMSSRRPVSRRRTVVDLPDGAAGQQDRRRDPRFSSLSASLPNKGVYQESYGFLRTQQADEVKLLRQTLSKLKRQEANHAGPRARSEAALRIREERERVEAALRREEGRENERRRREHESEVVRRAKKAIEERVKQGGKRFFLKDAEKKKLVLEDKFARLAGDGDKSSSSAPRGGLHRAMERRRKKNASKDRRIPLGGGSGGGGGVISDAYAIQDSAPLPKRKKLQGVTGDANTTRRRSNGVR